MTIQRELARVSSLIGLDVPKTSPCSNDSLPSWQKVVYYVQAHPFVFSTAGVVLIAAGTACAASSVLAVLGGLAVALGALLLALQGLSHIYALQQASALKPILADLRATEKISWSTYRSLSDSLYDKLSLIAKAQNLLPSNLQADVFKDLLMKGRVGEALDFMRFQGDVALRCSQKALKPTSESDADFYEKMQEALDDLATSLVHVEIRGLQNQLENLYEQFRLLFAQETKNPVLVTRFQSVWQKVNDAFEAVWQKTHASTQAVHLFCGCHLAPAGKTVHPLIDNEVVSLSERGFMEAEEIAAPLHEGRKPTALIFTIRAGAGNAMISRVMAKAMASSWHVQMAPSVTPFEERSWNFLCRRGWWKLTAFLMKSYMQKNNQYMGQLALREGLVKQAMALHNPQAVLLASPNTVAAAQKAASHQGIMMAAVAADFHTDEYGLLPRNLAGLTNTERFHMLVPTADDSVKAGVLHAVSEKQIWPVGYPVQSVFTEFALQKGNAAFIKHVKETIGTYLSLNLPHLSIPENHLVATVMMGSLGCGDALERYAAKMLSLSFEQPLHLFVCCGANEEAFRTISGYKNTAKVILHPLRTVDQKAIAALYTISQFLVTKPGGSTLAEAITMRVPMILDNTSGHMEAIVWEKANKNFAVAKGCGFLVENMERDLLQQIKMCLDRDFIYPALTIPPFKENFHEFMKVMYPAALYQEGIA